MKYLIAAVLTVIASPAFAQDSFGGSPQPQQQQPQQQQQGYPQQQQPPQQQSYPQQQQPPQQQQQAPQQQGYGQPGYGQQQQQGGGNLDQLTQMERQDYGVAPTSQLHSGPMHGPTPASIPGGQVITTKGLVELIQGGQTPFLLFDVLGGQEVIPGAQFAVPAHQPGSFNDQTQQEFGGYLQQATSGNKQTPLVFYCQSTQCWMSYNAALRAINMGYTNVLWYRGGIEAWKMAGMQTQNPYAQQQGAQQQQQQGGQPY